jgi:hypothetical protein
MSKHWRQVCQLKLAPPWPIKSPPIILSVFLYFGLFLAVHMRLEKYHRAKGLTGHALDCAMVAELPRKMAEILDGAVYH